MKINTNKLADAFRDVPMFNKQKIDEVAVDGSAVALRKHNDLLTYQNDLLEKSYEVLLQLTASQARGNQIALLKEKREVIQSELKYYLSQRGSERYKMLRQQLDAINKQIFDMEI